MRLPLGLTLALARLRKGTRPLETPAQRLRRDADEMEAKDAAIERLRVAVAALKGNRRDGANKQIMV